MSAIVSSTQSLNNIWMMSIRKCSIGVIRWCFFFKNRSVIFPGRRRLACFSISIGESSFFRRWANVFVAEQMKTCRCRSNHNFGWGRTKKPSRRRLQIFTATPNKKTSSTLKKYYRPMFVKKNCAMSAEKYQSGLYTDRCRLLYFLCNPWIIFGWCLIGNVRSASSGDASFLNLHRWSFSSSTLVSILFDQYRWVKFFSVVG